MSALLQSLKGKQAEVASRCISFLERKGGRASAARIAFREHVGDVAEFDSFLVFERGLDYGGSFEGAFLGRYKAGSYFLAYSDGLRNLSAESSGSDIAELFERVKQDWTMFKSDPDVDAMHNLCRFVTIQFGDVQKSYLQHTSLAWMSDEERTALGLGLSPLETFESLFKHILIRELSIPWR